MILLCLSLAYRLEGVMEGVAMAKRFRSVNISCSRAFSLSGVVGIIASAGYCIICLDEPYSILGSLSLSFVSLKS